ncbi:MAG: SDR family NAD(P)-dependent oxidoreductase, partial [Solirubrobacteraceae bacterium]
MASALVTGGGRGIGRAISLALAAEGHDVALSYAADRLAAEETAEMIRAAGSRSVAIEADLRVAGSDEMLIERSQAELGPVRILIANAGIASPPTG